MHRYNLISIHAPANEDEWREMGFFEDGVMKNEFISSKDEEHHWR
jgi:hypothetical protein